MRNCDPIQYMLDNAATSLQIAAHQLGVAPSLSMSSPLSLWATLFAAWGTDKKAIKAAVLSTTRIGYESVKAASIEGYECVPDFKHPPFTNFVDYSCAEFDFFFAVVDCLSIEQDERVSQAIALINLQRENAPISAWLTVFAMLTPEAFVFLDVITPQPELLFDSDASGIQHD